MLFGRLRVPYERLAAEPRSGLRGARMQNAPRGDSPRRALALVTTRVDDDDYVGLDRLDREELDETE